MRDRILDAIGSSRADCTEIRVEEKESTLLSFRGEEPQTAKVNIDKGGIVRCLVRDMNVAGKAG